MSKRNSYIRLQIRILWTMTWRHKISFGKILNAIHSYAAYFLKRQHSARSPLLIDFELWNECNERCVFCRSGNGDIYDLRPNGSGRPIPKGRMAIDVYKEIILQTKDRLLLSVPYINGEPLLSRDVYEAIRFATDHKIATMIATNGLLLNEANCAKLLDTGLDFIKIHISGFTQPVHSIQHRKGNVECVKENVARLARMNKDKRAGMLIMLDHIAYDHNQHEVELARRFAKQIGVMFNVRPGNPKGMEDTEPLQFGSPLPVDDPCIFLWTALSINWDGGVLPCCDYVVWSEQEPYGQFRIGETDILRLWNGPRAISMRNKHVMEGRTGIPICAKCPRRGIAFKW